MRRSSSTCGWKRAASGRRPPLTPPRWPSRPWRLRAPGALSVATASGGGSFSDKPPRDFPQWADQIELYNKRFSGASAASSRSRNSWAPRRRSPGSGMNTRNPKCTRRSLWARPLPGGGRRAKRLGAQTPNRPVVLHLEAWATSSTPWRRKNGSRKAC